MTCADCGVEVNPRAHGVYRQVVGWERVRSAGGANSVIDRKTTGVVLCPVCGAVRRYEHREVPGQLQLGD